MGRGKKEETTVSSRSPPEDRQSTNYACIAERLSRKYLRRYEEEQLLVLVLNVAVLEQVPQDGDASQEGDIGCRLAPGCNRNAAENHGAAVRNQHRGVGLLRGNFRSDSRNRRAHGVILNVNDQKDVVVISDLRRNLSDKVAA